MKHKFLIIILSMLIVGSGIYFSIKYTGLVSEYIPPSEQGTIEVYFCPKDNCKDVYLNLIKNSDKINCALYDVSEEIINELKERSKNIDVKLVSDNSNRINIKDLNFIKFDDNNQLMHNKFCIIRQNNKNIIVTGSLNPTEQGFEKNINNLVVIDSNYLSENYQQEFDELWSGIYGNGKEVKYPKIKFNNFLIENYFCPEDRCEEKIFNIIKNAKNKIYFMTFSFTSDTLGDLIIDKSLEGIEVKGLFEKFQSSKYSEFNKMKEKNLNVKFYNGDLLHHKVFIIDDTVIFGSYNPTQSGNEVNDENILIIHDKEITNKFLDEFNSLFENGK